MDFNYDKMANALYIRFSSEKVVNSDEIANGIIIDYGKNDKVIGVEILNFINTETCTMPIKFTKHALERMRIRGITKEEIVDAINYPDKQLNDS